MAPKQTLMVGGVCASICAVTVHVQSNNRADRLGTQGAHAQLGIEGVGVRNRGGRADLGHEHGKVVA